MLTELLATRNITANTSGNLLLTVGLSFIAREATRSNKMDFAAIVSKQTAQINEMITRNTDFARQNAELMAEVAAMKEEISKTNKKVEKMEREREEEKEEMKKINELMKEIKKEAEENSNKLRRLAIVESRRKIMVHGINIKSDLPQKDLPKEVNMAIKGDFPRITRKIQEKSDEQKRTSMPIIIAFNTIQQKEDAKIKIIRAIIKMKTEGEALSITDYFGPESFESLKKLKEKGMELKREKNTKFRIHLKQNGPVLFIKEQKEEKYKAYKSSESNGQAEEEKMEQEESESNNDSSENKKRPRERTPDKENRESRSRQNEIMEG